MPTELFKNMAGRLSKILGEENIVIKDNLIVARPSSTEETSSVLRLAHRANIETVPWPTRPESQPGPEVRLFLSLDRMNDLLRLDRESFCLKAGPAVPVRVVAELAGRAGLRFPGEECPHLKDTIGESIAECFKDGQPDFACLAACLCGLEMVLPDGEIITSGGACLTDLGNYSLAYLLSGYPANRAVLTGIFLKMLPHQTE